MTPVLKGTVALTQGELVVSLAGRDADRYYLVVECRERVVYVCDGVKRGTERPKRKNLRHLKSCGKVAADLGARLKAGEKVADGEIREALAALVEAHLQVGDLARGED